MRRELVRVMAIFWTSWLVATNMTPFAKTFHNRLRAAERMRNIVSYAQKQLQLFLGSYFYQLDFSPFSADQHASLLAVLVCSPFDCSCASTRSHPLLLLEVSRRRLLSLLQSSGSASFTCFVSLLSVLLRLSCALVRRHFVSFSARERSVFYLTAFLPDSELVRFAGAVLSLLEH